MNKFILIIFCILSGVIYSQAQTKPKEKAPTGNDIGQMMKEAQKAMDEMSPEDKKAMEDMGVKLPSMNNLPKVTDQQLQAGLNAESAIVPEKDIARIASISKTHLTSAAIPTYLKTVHGQLLGELDPYINESGEKIYQWIKNTDNTATTIGNEAAGFWMMGKSPVALYLMSKACMDDPTDADNLNNFSALLLMAGAEQLAIPILNNLNKQFPKNSTILNNIGQAWFGLGEIEKAGKYLDSTIQIYAYHSQANLTKSYIEESKGNTEAAIEAVKRSIKYAYSEEKEDRLNSLKYKLKSDDLDWDFPMPQDPLGLEKFKQPDYPESVTESEILEKDWDAFVTTCENEINGLQSQEKVMEQAVQEAYQQRTKMLLQAGNKGVMADLMPHFARKASIKLKYLVEGKDGHLSYIYGSKGESLVKTRIEVGENKAKLSENIEALKAKYDDQFGEGKANPIEKACADENQIKNNFLKINNTMLLSENSDYLNFNRRMINDRMYYCQYTTWPEDFELAKVQAKISFLGMLKSLKPEFQNRSSWCESVLDSKVGPFKLSKFEDMPCKYKSELNLLIGTITSNCSTLEAKLDLKIMKDILKIEVLKLGWTLKQRDNDDATIFDQFECGSAEIGLKKGFGIGTGPIKAEAKVGGSIFVEINRKGIADAGVKATADINVGTNFVKPLDGIKGIDVLGENGVLKTIDHSMGPTKDQSVTIVGAEAKIGISSGFTVEGKFLGKKIK